MTTIVRLTLAILALAAASGAAGADTYPSKPIRLIVPAPPAGPTDIVGRFLADALRQSLGQPVIVDNRVGGNGNVGAQAVATAEPDGYTLLLGHQALNTLNPVLYRKLPFDLVGGLAPITTIASQANLLAVPAKSPHQTLADVVGEARKRPGALNFGSTGIGTASHLLGEELNRQAGVKVVHVPYKGQGQAVTALLAGEVDMMFASVPVASPYLSAGTLRAIMVASPRRHRDLPAVPTSAEAGQPELLADVWFGLFAPAKTPPAIVDRLYKETVAALRSGALREALEKQKFEVRPSESPEAFAALVKREVERWRQVVESAKVELD